MGEKSCYNFPFKNQLDFRTPSAQSSLDLLCASFSRTILTAEELVDQEINVSQLFIKMFKIFWAANFYPSCDLQYKGDDCMILMKIIGKMTKIRLINTETD